MKVHKWKDVKNNHKEYKRTRLWAHIVSEHACIMDPITPMEDLEEYHQREHNGPGGIRNHPEDSRKYSLKSLGEVLSESDK